MKSRYGHNGPPVFETAADLPPNIQKMHYFKCDIQALRKAIIDKPLDVRGFYISVLLAMYEWMEPLPADDYAAQMRTGIKDIRTYRRMKASLVEMGLVAETPAGRITNDRFTAEIALYVEKFKNMRKAGLDREEKIRLEKAQETVSAEIGGDITPQSPPQSGVTSGAIEGKIHPTLNGQSKPIFPEKPNEYNEASTTNVPERDQKPTTTDPSRAFATRVIVREEEKKDSRPPDGGVTAPGAWLLDAPGQPRANYDLMTVEAFNLYNDLAQRAGLSVARSLTPERKRKLGVILRDYGGMYAWKTALANVNKSAFLRGQSKAGWRCDLDFLLQRVSFQKTFEGGYGNGAHAVPILASDTDPDAPSEHDLSLAKVRAETIERMRNGE